MIFDPRKGAEEVCRGRVVYSAKGLKHEQSLMEAVETAINDALEIAARTAETKATSKYLNHRRSREEAEIIGYGIADEIRALKSRKEKS